MLDTNIDVKLEQFDGPLGLLLHLVQKEELDVKNLDVNSITNQYLDYLAKMKVLDFDEAGDYLYMASTLLFLKSKTAVLEEDERKLLDSLADNGIEIQSKSELIKRLEELDRFQKLSQKLWALPKKGHDIFVKPRVNRKSIINSILTPIDMQELIDSMLDFIRKEKRKYTVVKRDRLSIKEKLVTLKNNLSIGQSTTLHSLLDEHSEEGVDDVVITFISLLELARLSKVSIFQNEDRGEVYVDVVNTLDDLDVDQANGFDSEDEIENKAVEETLMNAAVIEQANDTEELGATDLVQ